MTDIEIWLLIFIVGVIVFMVGVLMPKREVTIAGAIAAIVGGVGWLIVALN